MKAKHSIMTNKIDLGLIVLMDIKTGMIQFEDGSMTFIKDTMDAKAMFDQMEEIGVPVARNERFAVRCDAIAIIIPDEGVMHLLRPNKSFKLDKKTSESLINSIAKKNSQFIVLNDGSCLNPKRIYSVTDSTIGDSTIGIQEPGCMLNGSFFRRNLAIPRRVSMFLREVLKTPEMDGLLSH